MDAIVRTCDDAEANGFAKFNRGPHLCLEVPDGNATVSCRLSDGTRVTFAFVPYREGGRAECVDVQVHEPFFGEIVTQGDRALPIQRLIAFGAGPTFYSSYREDGTDPVTLTTFLLPKGD